MDIEIMDESSVQQLPVLLKDWMHRELELKTLSAEVREKRKKLAAIQGMITKIMKQSQIGKLNISTGAIVNRTKQTKGSITKKFLMEALTTYFKGDSKKAEECSAFLELQRPLRKVETLLLEPTN